MEVMPPVQGSVPKRGLPCQLGRAALLAWQRWWLARLAASCLPPPLPQPSRVNRWAHR